MKVFYLTLEGISSTVFESQVLAYTQKLQQQDVAVKLIIGQKLKARISLRKFFELLQDVSVRFLFLWPSFQYKNIAKGVSKRIGNEQELILHCRNIEAAYVGLLVKQSNTNKKIEVLYDVRGYVEGEAAYFNNEQKNQTYKKLNNILFKSEIYYNFVSEALYRLYAKEYTIPEGNVIFCNSAYDDAVFKLQEKKEERKNIIKILYVGGNQSYQKLGDIAKAFKNRNDMNITIVTSKKQKRYLLRG